MRYARQATDLRLSALLLILVLAPAACTAETLQVYTVNYPLAYIAERIAGDQAEVVFPAPPGMDPAFWMPDTDTIAAYQAADLILLNGAGYAKWTAKVSLPRFRLVDTSRVFKDAYIRVEGEMSHSHGPGGEHAHGGTAFTTWLDLQQAVQQAEAVAAALVRKRPDAKGQIDEDLQALKRDLQTLDARIVEITSSDPGRLLLASHPVYQYLARRYGVNLKSVTWEPDKVPSEVQWAELGHVLQEHPAKSMLWEAEPAPETAERLRHLGVETIVFDPCSNRPAAGDFLSRMAENAITLEKVYR